MDAVKLAKKYTIQELTDLRKQIEDDPKSKNTKPGSIYLYTEKARKKLDAIGWAITYRLAEEREAAGNPVPTNGYSGRKSNRR